MMRKIIYLAFLFLSLQVAQAQIGMGTRTPNSNAVLDLTSSNKALLLPRVTSALSVTTPTDGMVVFDVSQACTRSYEKGTWSKCLSFEPAQIPHLVSVSGLLNTVNGGASSAVVYETEPGIVKLDLAPGRRLLSVTTASTGATVSIIDQVNGLVLVKTGTSDVVLNAIDQAQIATLNGLQLVDVTTSSLTLSTSNQNYSLGTTLQDGDILEIEHQFDGVATERQMLWVKVRPGTTQRAFPWENATGTYVTSFTFPSTLTNVLQVLAASTTSTPVILSIRVWRDSANGFVVPAGNVAIPTCTVTANGGAVTVNGLASYTTLQTLPSQFQIGLAVGRRLLSCKVGGVDVFISNTLTGMVSYTPTSSTVDFQVVDTPVSTYIGRQTVGRYIANPSFDISNTTLTTNIDMSTAKYLTLIVADITPISFDGVSGVHTWQALQYDLSYLRSNNGLAYGQSYNNAYIEFHIQDFATGRIFFNDQIRNVAIREVLVETDGLNSLVTPLSTAVRSSVIVTCNGGAVNIDNYVNTTLYKGTSSRVTIPVPSGQMINTATINNGLSLAISDAYTGALEVAIANGSSATSANITVTYVAIPSGIIRYMPVAGSSNIVLTNTTTCSYNFTPNRSGLWDIDSNIMGWDNVQTPDLAFIVEILQGATVLDAFQFGGLSSNHLLNTWMIFGQASNRVNLTAGTTYTIRVTSNGSSALNGVSIQSMVMRLVQAGNSPLPSGTVNKVPVTVTLSSQTWAHTNNATAVVLEDAGSYIYRVVPPLNQVLSGVSSSPVNIVNLKDADRSLVVINAPTGTGNITVTPTFSASTAKIRYRNVGVMQFNANTWATRSFGIVDNDGLSGPDVNSFYTATRDMVLDLVATLDSFDSASVNFGFEWQVFVASGTNWMSFNPDGQTQSTPASGITRYTESKMISLKKDDKIRLQNFVSSPTATRTVRVSITEL